MKPTWFIDEQTKRQRKWQDQVIQGAIELPFANWHEAEQMLELLEEKKSND